MINLEIKIDSVADAINVVKKASELEHDTNFTNGRCFVDAKSLLGVLSADFSRPCKLIIIADEIDSSIEKFIDSIRDKIIEMEVSNEKH